MADLEGRLVFFPGDARPLFRETPDDMLDRALYFEQLAYSGNLEDPTVAIAHAMRVLDHAIMMEAYFRNHNL